MNVTIRVTDSQIRLVVGLEMAESVLAVARDLAKVAASDAIHAPLFPRRDALSR